MRGARERLRISWPFLLAALALLSGCSVAPTRASAQSAATPLLQYVGAWGTKGDDPGQLDQPTGIATDAQGNVYIADPGSQYIDKFRRDGTPLLSFQDLRLKHPQSIAVDRGGAIYVSDPVRASVLVFLPDGTLYREIHLLSRRSEENTLAVTVAYDGSMSVLDVNAAKVFDFSPTFRLEHVWKPGTGIEGVQGSPRAIAAGSTDAVYVGGMAPNSVLRYIEGKFSANIELGDTASIHNGVGDQLALSPAYIFSVDSDGQALRAWTLNGTSKANLDLAAQLGDSQRFPPPIAVSPLGELLVLDTQQARILRYRINL